MPLALGLPTYALVSLVLYAGAALLRIQVEDTGPAAGFEPAADSSDGQGLIGMRERAALYGGTVTTGRTRGGGWTVQTELKLAPAQERTP